MGYPSLVSTASQLLVFNRRTCIALEILAQTPVSLGGKTILVDFMVIEDPLDFNMLLGRDYVYAMQAVVSIFFHVMYLAKKLSLSTSWIFLIRLLTQLETRSFLYYDSQCFYRHYPTTGELCCLMSFLFNSY